jgi:hypothetical protein
MAAGSALKKINARVKHLAKLHPGKKRVTLQKQAGAEYRAGKLGGVKKSRKKTVRRIKALHAAEGRAIRKLRGVKRRRRLSGTLSAGASSGIMGVRSTFQAAAIGGLSTAQHLAHAKKKIEQEIGAAEVRKFVAKKKTVKRKISKRIAELKSRFRKLC